MAAIENEIGHGGTSLIPESPFFDVSEDVFELRWPTSIHYYDRMRNDPQIASLLLALFLPIRRYEWVIKPNGARDEVVELIANDLDLPIDGQEQNPKGRRRDRFSHDMHLYHALLSKVFGAFFFEQVYRYYPGDPRAHLHKLAPRMPATISEVKAAPDGGLEYIRQWPSGWQQGQVTLSGLQSPKIPVDRLVAYVSDQEGGGWFGRSWLRACYRPWLLKDRMLRVDAINQERNGSGVPIAYAPPGASSAQLAELAKLAQSYRAGEASGGAIPNGADLKFKGVEGSLPDTLASIRYQDEEMANRFCAQFTKLGSTSHGSRALGETLANLFYLAQTTIAKEYADRTNEHVIEDLVDLNWGIDESAPLLEFRTDGDKRLAIADLCLALDKGAVTADSELESYIRAEYNLPEKDPNAPITVTSPSDSTAKPAAASQRVDAAIEEQPTDPNDAIVEAAFATALLTLTTRWRSQAKPKLVDALVEAARLSASDVGALAGLCANPVAKKMLADALLDMADQAAKQAAHEAALQGVEVAPPSRKELRKVILPRATAADVFTTRVMSQSAARVGLENAGLSEDDVAQAVRTHLEGLSDVYVTDELGGALMMAQNEGRFSVFDQALEAGGTLEATEISDPAICVNCEGVNGKIYESVEDAHLDYPNGGFRACLGGVRCRGRLRYVAEQGA